MMRFFATPQDAEAAFYDALERADVDAMMRIWAEDEEVVCIHAQGDRAVGFAAVRESWQRIFSTGPLATVRHVDPVHRQGVLLAMHNLLEQYSVPGETQSTAPVIASHVYVRGAQGWHLLSRHTSFAPKNVDVDSPSVLH